MILSELAISSPELSLLCLASILLIADTFFKKQRNSTFYLSEIIIIIIICLLFFVFPEDESYLFNGLFIHDQLASVIKIITCLLAIIIFYYSDNYLSEHGWLRGEYYVLGLFCVLGIMIIASAANLLVIYLGLELMSLSLYAMVAMHRNSSAASEAAMKYFIMGAIASGLLLYGISILYGVTGSIDIQAIKNVIELEQYDPVLMRFALVFIIAALAFKFGTVPFHMWVPDVYQGSPTSVVLFISTISKLAIFAIAFRVIGGGFLNLIDYWQTILITIAILSIALGNIVAIAQTNIKRMLAYSTIAHMGFVLLGLLSFDTSSVDASGYSDALFYVISYSIMSLAVFGIVILLGRRDAEADELADYQGLVQRNPWFAFIMLILMSSLAGVPPFLGFWAKVYVLSDVVKADLVWLAVITVFFSIIGAYYYLRVIKLIYFDEAQNLTAIKASQTFRFILSINGLSVLLLGLFPAGLMNLCIKILS